MDAKNVQDDSVQLEDKPEEICKTKGCARTASYDHESGGYFAWCERCFGKVGYRKHVHVERYWPEYLAAHPEVDPNHTWRTAQMMHPVVKDDVVVSFECASSEPCGFTEPCMPCPETHEHEGLTEQCIRDAGHPGTGHVDRHRVYWGLKG